MAIWINQQAVQTMLFPGGECQVNVSSCHIGATTHIVAQLNHANDIMCLLLAVDAVRRIHSQTQIFLSLPYMPYARQDRVCNEGEALSVRVMADLINGLHCAQVIVIDPHSDVTPALLNNCKVVSMAEVIADSGLVKIIAEQNLMLVSPDAGAAKKVAAVAKKLASLGVHVEVLCASKTRDTLTGKITATQLHADVSGKNLLILDDICDGGRTFTSLAKVLKNSGANELYLYVTHGIFSQGLQVFAEDFQQVFCYHSLFGQSYDGLLTVLGELT